MRKNPKVVALKKVCLLLCLAFGIVLGADGEGSEATKDALNPQDKLKNFQTLKDLKERESIDSGDSQKPQTKKQENIQITPTKTNPAPTQATTQTATQPKPIQATNTTPKAPTQNFNYSHCKNYYLNASVPVGNTRAIALKHKGKKVYLLQSKTRPNAKILKADPFVGLYLVESGTSKLSYNLLALDSRTLKDPNLATISAKEVKKGKITARQSGYLNYAKFSSPLAQNSVIGNICYQIYGIGVGGNGFLEKKYIDRFLNVGASYSDIGVRFDMNVKKPLVRLIDPFFPNNPFMVGDEIVSVNGKKVGSVLDTIWIITNLTQNTSAKIAFKRDGKVHTISIKPDKMYGGLLLSDTFLERFGVAFGEDLEVLSLNDSGHLRLGFLKEGDKIVWINKKEANIHNIKELLSNSQSDEELQQYGGKIQLLIHRGEAEFFIKI